MPKHPLIIALLLSAPIHAADLQSMGPFGGSAAIVQVVPHHPGTVLAATTNALLFRSTDGGASWARIPFPAELRSTLHAFVVGPRTDVYWAGVADDTGAWSGIYRSTDEGLTWTLVTGLKHTEVWSIAVFRRDEKIVAAGTRDGVFLTRDGGTNWEPVSPESNLALKPVVSLAFDPVDSRILYAGTTHLPWKTTDSGVTWQPVFKGMENDSDVFSIHINTLNPDHVFASACSGMYRTVDGAANWTRLIGAVDASYRTYQLVQHPTQPNVLLAGTAHGLVKSTNAGKTWRRLSNQSTRSIAFDPVQKNRIFVATEEGGLFLSDDLGESLRAINNGFCNRPFLSIAATANVLFTTTAATALNGGVFRQSESDGQGWADIQLDPKLPREPVIKVAPVDEMRVFALTSSSVLSSVDGGTRWSIQSGAPTGERLTALLVSSHDNTLLFVGGANGIYYVDGETWRQANHPRLDSPIRSLVEMRSGAIAAITRSMLLRSTDGLNYSAPKSPLVGADLYMLLSTDQGSLLIATSKGLRRSEDSGMTWQPVKGIPDGNTISSICQHPSWPGVLLASGYGAILKSSDDGRSWTLLRGWPDMLPAIKELVVLQREPGRLYLLTHHLGLFTLPLDSVRVCPGSVCITANTQ